MPFDDMLAGFKENGQEGAEVLRIHRIGMARRPYDIATENRELTSVGGHIGAGLVKGATSVTLQSRP
jgi:hypothetical protein